MALPIGSGMREIFCGDQVSPFAGKIVAYHADSPYFTRNGYRPWENYFGYIDEKVWDWSTGEKGHSMSRLFNSNSADGPCGLINSQLKYPISMRLATGEEIRFIERAITSNRAEFAGSDIKHINQKISEIVNRQLSKL